MNTRIFTAEIEDLEQAIAQLKTKLIQLKEVEDYADIAIDAMQTAIQKIKAIAPQDINKFKDAMAELLITEEPHYQSEPEYLEDPEQPEEEENSMYMSPHGQFEIIGLSETIAYCRNNYENSIQCAYAGFNNKLRAEQWGNNFKEQNIINRFEIRPARRLDNFKYELKMWNISLESLQAIANYNLASAPTEKTLFTVEF